MRGIIVCIALWFSFPLPNDPRPTDIIGYWLIDTEDVIVEIYQKEDSTFAGDIAWLRDSLDIYNQPLRDVLNHEPTHRSRLVKGLTVLHDFTWSSGAWRNGTYYNFKTGNDNTIKMSLGDEGALRLTSSYGLLFFLSKTKTWTPVTDAS